MKKLPFVLTVCALALSFAACNKSGGDNNAAADNNVAAKVAAPAGKAAASEAKAADAASDKKDDGAAKIGIAACEEYVAKYLKCIEKMPEAAREPARQGLKQMSDSWKAAATAENSEALGNACKQAMEAAKAATAAIGCEW